MSPSLFLALLQAGLQDQLLTHTYCLRQRISKVYLSIILRSLCLLFCLFPLKILLFLHQLLQIILSINSFHSFFSCLFLMLDQLFPDHYQDPKFWDSLYFLAILQCLTLLLSELLELKLLQALPHFLQQHLNTHLMAYKSYKCISDLLRAKSIWFYLFFYLKSNEIYCYMHDILYQEVLYMLKFIQSQLQQLLFKFLEQILSQVNLLQGRLLLAQKIREVNPFIYQICSRQSHQFLVLIVQINFSYFLPVFQIFIISLPLHSTIQKGSLASIFWSYQFPLNKIIINQLDFKVDYQNQRIFISNQANNLLNSKNFLLQLLPSQLNIFVLSNNLLNFFMAFYQLCLLIIPLCSPFTSHQIYTIQQILIQILIRLFIHE